MTKGNPMETRIKVESIKEARLLRAGLKDPQTRALVKVVGALSALSSNRARIRTLRFVEDHLAEERGK